MPWGKKCNTRFPHAQYGQIGENSLFFVRTFNTYVMNFFVRALCLGLVLSLTLFVTASGKPNPNEMRVLFVLDASGSMGEIWNGTSKLDLSKNLLLHVMDSVSRVNKHVQFGLRVFGHQFDRAAYNCKDSRLEVAFGPNNIQSLKDKLAAIKPRGQTPIAYALYEAASDFNNDSTSIHAVILITDGEETCQGDPCAVGQIFTKRRIAMKPFIVGLGLSAGIQEKYKCLGMVYDVQNAAGFKNTMDVVMAQALNNTTAQLNLLDAYGQPTTTNVAVTLSDHFTHRPRYEFVQALNKNGDPDTLYLDPTGRYDITVHTTPPVTKQNIELIPGKHNMIALDVPTGFLELKQKPPRLNLNPPVECIITNNGENQTIAVMDLNSALCLGAGTYDLTILTQPRIHYYGVNVVSGRTNTIEIPQAGVFRLTGLDALNASLFTMQGDKQVLVWDFGKMQNTTQQLFLQPGSYFIIYRPDKGKRAAYTQRQNVEIKSGEEMVLRIN